MFKLLQSDQKVAVFGRTLASVRPETVFFDWPTKIHSIVLGATNQYRYVFGRFSGRVNDSAADIVFRLLALA